MKTDCSEILKRVRRAWDKVIRRGKDLKILSRGIKRDYHQWVRSQAEKVKMPFQIPTMPTIDEPSIIVSPEIEELMMKLAKVEEDKLELKKKLNEVQRTCETLTKECTEKDHDFKEVSKKAKIGSEYTLRARECLKAANKELGLRRQERDEALAENRELKSLIKSANMARGSAEKQVVDMKLQMEEMVAEYEEREKRMQGDIQKLLDHTDRQNETIIKNRHEAAHWMTRFSKLAALANGAIADVQYGLRKADGMTNPLTTPMEICDFIDYCKSLISEMKQLANASM